jgi:helix-turn-helix protein
MSARYLSWAFSQPVKPPARKLVLVALADAANDDGVCWPGQLRLGEKCSCSERAVRNHLHALQEAGLIEREAAPERWRAGRPTLTKLLTTPAKAAGVHRQVSTPTPAKAAGVHIPDETAVKATRSKTLVDGADQLLQHWEQLTGQRLRARDNWCAKLSARLRTFTADEIRTAMAVVAHSEWHKRNSQVRLHLVVRSDPSLEDYLQRARAERPGWLTAEQEAALFERGGKEAA